ncbi:hypothetical protein VNI00_015686 [Paramarasmius palmivorus]|uniref:Uncharacterized protein n=1 Tax=Paramarasmius palmivorus TaxID=297713 RepID=A0AAW0BIC4_9AGAR
MLSTTLPHAVNLTVLTLYLIRLGPYPMFIASIVNGCDFPRLEVANLTVPVTKETFSFLKRHRLTLKKVLLDPMCYFGGQAVFDLSEKTEFPLLETLSAHTWIAERWLNVFSTPRLECLHPIWTSYDPNTVDDVIIAAQSRVENTLSSLKLELQRHSGLRAANMQLVALQLSNLTSLEIQLTSQMSSIEDMGLDMPSLTSTRDALLMLPKLRVFKWTADRLPPGFGSGLDLQHWTISWLTHPHKLLSVCQVPTGLVWLRVTQYVWFPEEVEDAGHAFSWCFRHLTSRTFPVLEELLNFVTGHFLQHDSMLSDRVSLFLRRQEQFVEDNCSEVEDMAMDIMSMVALIRSIRYKAVLQSPNYLRLRKLYTSQ